MKSLSVLALTGLMFLTGCAVDKYQAAVPAFQGTSGTGGGDELVVLLQPVFAGKPFSETVCDNTVGVSWSPEESHNIGFTQRYAKSISKNATQFAMLAALPANQRVGMSASGTAEPINIDSRIMVPVGRFITENLKLAIGSKGQVCEDEACFQKARQERPSARFVAVQFSKFRVAEAQRNTLLIEAEGTATVNAPHAAQATVPIYNKLNRSIAAEGLFHSDFLRVMNKIANESSANLVEQIRRAGT
ncbi:MAG: hypothetical protein ACJ8HI_08330 [Massilia sp.]